ncbi:MAG: Bug family tripartite tricarboxylate transporter substrate binding protein [Comamonas sp.]
MPISRRQWLARGAWFCAPALLGQAAMAQAWPARPIRLVVPAPPGGASDNVARLLGEHLTQSLGQPVVVDNRPGGSTIIGNSAVAKAAPDGYTLLLGFTSLVQIPSLYANLPYDYQRDLVPISLISTSADLFIVSSKVPANMMADFVALVKSGKARLNYGSYGTGTSSHMHGELLKMRAGIDMVHAPYKGAAPLLQDILAGQIDCGFVDINSASGHLQSPKIKVLGITGAERSTKLPDVPTFAQLGYAGFEPYGWIGIFAPAGTPTAITTRLATEFSRATRSPEVSQRLVASGMTPVGSGAKELATVLRDDAPVWAEIAKTANIKLD